MAKSSDSLRVMLDGRRVANAMHSQDMAGLFDAQTDLLVPLARQGDDEMTTTYSKTEAMRLARADFDAGRFDEWGYTFSVWGGTTKYVASRQGVERVMRDDNGGTRGIRRPDVLVVPASKIAK